MQGPLWTNASAEFSFAFIICCVWTPQEPCPVSLGWCASWVQPSPLLLLFHFLLCHFETQFPLSLASFLLTVVPLPSQGPSGVSITLPKQVMAAACRAEGELLLFISADSVNAGSALIMLFSINIWQNFKFSHNRDSAGIEGDLLQCLNTCRFMEMVSSGHNYKWLDMFGSCLLSSSPGLAPIWFHIFTLAEEFLRTASPCDIGSSVTDFMPSCVLRRTKIPFPGGFWNCARRSKSRRCQISLQWKLKKEYSFR